MGIIDYIVISVLLLFIICAGFAIYEIRHAPTLKDWDNEEVEDEDGKKD